MFGLFRAWRRKRLAKRPFPEAWLPILRSKVPFYNHLAPEYTERFHDLLKVFVWEKHFIGAGGLEISDEHRVVIAASAVRLALHLDLSYYDRLTEILVYPYVYKHPEGEGAVYGEAHAWGTVVLSWPAVEQGLANPYDSRETAAHEFAHVLDRADGVFDGTPELRTRGDYEPWAQTMSEHYLRLRKRRRPQRDVLRMYGAISEAEFFAVATEVFFERPQEMKDKTPGLYAEMQAFYGGDPASAMPEVEVKPVRRIYRNDPCPCGSGKKYKKCCGRRR